MATGCEQGVIAGGGVGAAAVDAPATQLIEVEVSAYVRRIHRPRTRARCRCAPASEAVAPPPARLFANTAYGVSVWAWFVLECYAYHRPLRAVARALATMGIPVAPGTLADAQSRLLRVFEPLDEAIAERQRPASLVQGDETRWMIQVRGERGENPRCWLWVCVSEDAVRMHIDPTRSARAARVPTPCPHSALSRPHPHRFCNNDSWKRQRHRLRPVPALLRHPRKSVYGIVRPIPVVVPREKARNNTII